MASSHLNHLDISFSCPIPSLTSINRPKINETFKSINHNANKVTLKIVHCHLTLTGSHSINLNSIQSLSTMLNATSYVTKKCNLNAHTILSTHSTPLPKHTNGDSHATNTTYHRIKGKYK